MHFNWTAESETVEEAVLRTAAINFRDALHSLDRRGKYAIFRYREKQVANAFVGRGIGTEGFPAYKMIVLDDEEGSAGSKSRCGPTSD